ncbi:four helix bundle protein [bacterium]|nr:four helix bundle protein [bacterium]
MMLTKTFCLGVSVMKEMDKLNTSNSSIRIIVNQISRAASSVGANYRAACRAKSKRDFINKLKYVEEESDEVIYWLEMLKAVHPKVYTGDLDKLHDQAELSASPKTELLKSRK